MIFHQFKIPSAEKYVFWGSLFFYGLIGFGISANTLLSLHPKYIHDLYLGFDNSYHNTSFVRHPLLKIISLALAKISVFISSPEYFLVGICTVLLAVQNLFLFKYLTKIIQLEASKAFLILLFYAGFSSNLILSFTFESYVFSTSFLSIFIYFVTQKQLSHQRLRPLPFFSFLALIGGITLTNGLKVLILNYYQKPKALFRISTVIGGILGIFVLIFRDNIWSSLSHTLQFLKSGIHYFSDIFYFFLGGSVVFPRLEIQNLYYENTEKYNRENKKSKKNEKQPHSRGCFFN